jgi:3'-phosphoadenosine 5'-phosphosulfate sulfotransferase (PAPS reductase)/FAD synthetase
LKIVYDLFVSGGRDSVVAATIGFQEAREKGAQARVVFINELKSFRIPENILPYSPLTYVRQFSEWLGVRLVVLEPNIDFWEGVKKWGYPLVYDKRWCFHFMKKKVLEKFAVNERRDGYSPTWVTGIRRSESSRRSEIFNRKRYIYKVGEVYLEYYHPILDWEGKQVEEYIVDRKIPVNPLWEIGFSFECLCMAGVSKKKLDRIMLEMPKLAEWLSQRDREVQACRKSGEPAYVNPLLREKITLYEYLEDRKKQSKITSYI